VEKSVDSPALKFGSDNQTICKKNMLYKLRAARGKINPGRVLPKHIID
jgi:hypothetical protein